MENLSKNIDIKKIKGILIDFDNTMYEYAPCHKAGLTAAHIFYTQKHPVSYDDFVTFYSAA